MLLNRRGWLGLVAAASAAPAFAAAGPLPRRIQASGTTPRFQAAAAALADYALAELAAYGFPGMAIAMRSGNGQVARLALGHAKVDGTPVTADNLFQIGSISKSLVAMALYTLADRGKLDLDAPALSIVPELPLPDTGITIVQLLAHSAGLPGDAPPFPSVPGGRLWSATPPGQRFSYSNAGYDMLAYVIERISGQPYDVALAQLVLRPLGMTSAQPVIRTADRSRYAQGYVPFQTDRPWFPRAALAEGPWLDVDRAAGSVAMTSADMAAYVAFVGRVARGDGAPLFGPALARRFATPVILDKEFAADSRYGAGLSHFDHAGGPVLFHTGGMLLFSSAVCVDATSGAGVFASCNFAGSSWRPRAVAKYGVELLRAAAGAKPLPPAPAIPLSAPVDKAADCAGRFVAPGGDTIVVVAAGDQLTLGSGARLRASGDNRFVTDDAVRSEHVLDYVAAPARRDQLWWGGTLYGRDVAPPQPAPDPRVAPLAGVYASNDPWIGGASVVVRGPAVVVEGAGEVHPHADGSWRFVDPEAITDRLWFEALVGGVPERLNWSGQLSNRLRG